ncbi:MAG: hypothetical protein JWN17_2875, partial [Frankiales bacterium]|nr:hypothetical protein [Frankiales bacterium]
APSQAAPAESPSESPSETPSPYAVGPTQSPTAAPAESASPTASPEPSASPSSASSGRTSTSLAFSAPTSASTTAVPVGIRLLSDGRAVRNGYVRLEKSTSSGWTYVGRLLTNGDGVGKGTLRVAGSATLRAAYTGSQVRTPAVSPARVVKARNDLRTGDVDGNAVLQEAARHVGAPYVYGADGPDAFDCSGFTRYVYGRFGKSLPHNARAQEDVTTPVSKADAQPGDLVFIQDVKGHVGIYAGGGRMYDAPHSGASVTLRSIWTSNYTVGRVR